MFDWTFAQPLWLLGVLLVPTGLILRAMVGRKRQNKYIFSSLRELPDSKLGNVRANTAWFTWLAIGALFIALARPQTSELIQTPSQNLGIDMMMAVDISASMMARDLEPNRLAALKNVAVDFITNRTLDRMGLVIYAGEAYSPVPLTTDHSLLNQQIRTLHYDLLEGGTAIGMGLSTAVSRLIESDAKSKVVILLTDGENNAGLIDPIQAAELAASTDVKVYTIGIGTNGVAPTPVGYDAQGELVYRPKQVTLDEDLLKRIADMTGGQYFRATDNESLSRIYKIIDGLEKSEIEGFQFYRYTEHFEFFAWLALGLIAVELLLNFVLLKTPF